MYMFSIQTIYQNRKIKYIMKKKIMELLDGNLYISEIEKKENNESNVSSYFLPYY